MSHEMGSSEKVASGNQVVPSASSPCLVPHIAAQAQNVEEPPRELQINLRIFNVKSDFRLSENPEFRANFEAIAAHCVGKYCQISRETLIIQYSHHAGKCRIARNGLVQLYAQVSFEEADLVADRVCWDFKHIAHQDVGVFNRRYTWLNASGELPYEVSLNRLKRSHPEIQYASEIAPAAAISFEEINILVNLFRSGRFTVFGAGDCNPVDYALSKTSLAIDKLVELTEEFMIANSQKEELLVASADRPVHPIIPPKKKFTQPRRSVRLHDCWVDDEQSDDDMNSRPGMTQHLSKLDLTERRLHQFLIEFAALHGEKSLSGFLKEIPNGVSPNGISLERWQVVTKPFLIKGTGPVPFGTGLVIPEIMLPEEPVVLLDVSSRKKRKRKPEADASTKMDAKKQDQKKKLKDKKPSYTAEDIAAAEAIRTEPLTTKDYLVRVLGRMEQWQ
ncbi:hypothetical protein BV898_16269 [Hypsibius exemplaris]|uniref:Uncharacterized protein n=1 Tax=Hypsibius exemplaris TaxID=2072580 RepID=A0A9X6NFJ6_HYPEX|nr:hypothetical protein BV898_16269 [Hypsibius exemplaris]